MTEPHTRAVGAGTESRPDFLISYVESDRPWAEWIAWNLENNGYPVLLEAWDLGPGDRRIDRMNDGILRSRHIVAVLSPDYLRSTDVTAQWQTAFYGDPDGTKKKLVPVRVAACAPTGLLAGIIMLDLVGLDEQEARKRLVRTASWVLGGGRLAPAGPPPFPPGPLPAAIAEAISRPATPGKRIADDALVVRSEPVFPPGPPRWRRWANRALALAAAGAVAVGVARQAAGLAGGAVTGPVAIAVAAAVLALVVCWPDRALTATVAAVGALVGAAAGAVAARFAGCGPAVAIVLEAAAATALAATYAWLLRPARPPADRHVTSRTL